MNILFLAPRFPLPADSGGKIRTLNILKQIIKENTVHLLCFSFEDDDPALAQQLERMGIKTTLVPMKDPTTVTKIVHVLLSPVPFSINKYHTAAMREAIEAILQRESIDAVHVDHLHMAHYHDLFGRIPAFLDEHNIEHKILERSAAVEPNIFKRLLIKNQAIKMRVFEARRARLFKAVFVCSLDDRLILSKLTSGLVPSHVIPNGVDTDYFNGTGISVPIADSLVFTGSMDWMPNDDAITYFCKNILPLIWEKKNTVKVYVVGKSPSIAVKELAAKDKRVIVTGRVDDVRPFMESATLFIVPLRIGGGTRLKILEAMSMRKAVISTSIGAEGIACKKGVDIVLADSPDDFAKSVVDTLNAPETVKSMSELGRDLVCREYDWHIVGKKLNAIYKESVHASQ